MLNQPLQKHQTDKRLAKPNAVAEECSAEAIRDLEHAAVAFSLIAVELPEYC